MPPCPESDQAAGFHVASEPRLSWPLAVPRAEPSIAGALASEQDGSEGRQELVSVWTAKTIFFMARLPLSACLAVHLVLVCGHRQALDNSSRENHAGGSLAHEEEERVRIRPGQGRSAAAHLSAGR